MDVVYVLGEHTEELRYSMRSLANVDHDQVWIVGHLPDWVTNVGHIPMDDQWEKARNIAEKMYAAASNPEVSERFIYFNDDFFAMKRAPIPNRHRGPEQAPRPAGLVNNRMSLKESRRWTFYHLRHTWSVDPVLSYDFVHTPMVVEREAMAEAIEKARKIKFYAPQVRSLYGNLHQIGGDIGPNAKRGKASDTVGKREWVSTNVNSWGGKAGAEIRARFPDPSPYERT